ncbi:hypothetical protein VRB95_15620 [Erwinia aphidicola]|uniref:hypothetical protein n=1 Tax=Erwinia aphidicola TaxID=68334 RepID=UPI0030D1AD6E
MDNRMDRLEGHVGILQGDVSILKIDVGVLQKDVGILKVDVDRLKDDVGVLKSDVKELKEDVSTLKIDVGIIKSNYATQSDVNGLRVELHQCLAAQTRWIAISQFAVLGFGLAIAKLIF